MAIFNPQEDPVQPKTYEREFRPIGDIAADKSTALAISGATEALASGVGLAEQTAQEYLKEKVSAGVNTLRGATTLSYEDIRNAALTGGQASPQAQRTAGFTGTLVQDQTDAPPALQAGLDRAGDIATARNQGTVRANDTLYTGALNSLAKQLRNEFPGHKDFIDEQIAKISGKNPANAYMDNLLQDIRSSGAKADTYEKQITSKAMENFGSPDVRMYMDAFHAKIPGAFEKLTDAVQRAEEQKYRDQRWKTQSDQNKTDLAGDADLAKSQGQQKLSSIAFRAFNPVIDIPGLTSPQMQQQLLDEARAGLPSSIKAEQWEQMYQNAQRARDLYYNQAKDAMNEGGFSRRMRDPTYEKTMIENEGQYLDRQVEAIGKRDVGMMFSLQRRSKLIEDNAKYAFQTDKTMGDFFVKSKLVRENLPDAWQGFLTQKALAGGALGQFQNWFEDRTAAAGVPDNIRKDGVAKNMTADIITARKAEADHRVPSRLYDDLVENVNLITKAQEMGQPQVAREIALYSFDPKYNSNLIDQFGRDFTDKDGVFHKGKFAYYDVMTRPKVVDSVFALKDKDTWDKMKDWQEVSFKTLFTEEVKSLNRLTDRMATMPNLPSGASSVPSSIQPKLRWENNQIIGEFPPMRDMQSAAYIDAARQGIKDLNKGLANLAYMHGKDTNDPTSTGGYLVNVLMSLGYSPNDRMHGDNMPQRLIEAIAASQKPKPETGAKGAYEVVK